MLEDELLKLRFLCGSSRALAQIYRKYADRLLTLATALLRDAVKPRQGRMMIRPCLHFRPIESRPAD